MLSNTTLRQLCEPAFGQRPMISPFTEKGVFKGLSYGLSYVGYDVRIAESISLYPPHRVSSNSPPHIRSFKLASTIEHFSMPLDISAKVEDKSTWLRIGLKAGGGRIEPGWRGYLTLELENRGFDIIDIEAGTPIAQIVFSRLDRPVTTGYSGKYQDQSAGPQLPLFDDDHGV